MACISRTFFVSIFLISHYHYRGTKCAPITETDEVDLLHYIAHELPRQLDKAELVDDPFVRIEKTPEAIVRVQEGDSVTLECEAIGIPPPVISWRKNGKRIKQTERDDETNAFEKLMNVGSRTVESSTTAGRLHFDCVEPSMSGLYECVAENGYGRTSNRTTLVVLPREDGSALPEQCVQQMASDNSEILVAPFIVMFTEFRFENEGNSAQLFCRASGHPKPKITWLDSNEQVLEINENQYILPNGDLFLRNIQGYEQYFCVASNVAGEDRTDSFLYATA